MYDITLINSQKFRDLIEASDNIDGLSTICAQAISDYKLLPEESKHSQSPPSDTERLLQIIDKNKVMEIKYWATHLILNSVLDIHR